MDFNFMITPDELEKIFEEAEKQEPLKLDQSNRYKTRALKPGRGVLERLDELKEGYEICNSEGSPEQIRIIDRLMKLFSMKIEKPSEAEKLPRSIYLLLVAVKAVEEDAVRLAKENEFLRKKLEGKPAKTSTIEVEQTLHVRDVVTPENLEQIFEAVEKENPFPSKKPLTPPKTTPQTTKERK